jgi:hypothetical protein
MAVGEYECGACRLTWSEEELETGETCPGCGDGCVPIEREPEPPEPQIEDLADAAFEREGDR